MIIAQNRNDLLIDNPLNNFIMDKIRIIDEPLSEEMLRAELEAVLGGWTCQSYDANYNSCAVHNPDDDATCNGSKNYCKGYVYANGSCNSWTSANP
jgi:23S rRNA C2498 (ribose-2'-O)-methylase RlmM